MPWRPASGEHRPDRAKTCPVRRDRVRSDDRLGRCALRSCLSPDGFPALRPAGGGERASSTDISRSAPRKSRWARSTSAVMSLRAAIRAKVLLARLDRTFRTKRLYHRIARAYFELARRLIHPPAPPDRDRRTVRNRQIGPGARARSQILPQPGAVVLRSDVLRKQHVRGRRDRTAAARAPIGRRLPQQSTIARAATRLRILVAGPFRRRRCDVCPRESDERQSATSRAGWAPGLSVYFLQTDLATRQSRVGRREARCVRRHARGRRTSGEIRYRRDRLDRHRCLRNARADPEAHAGSRSLGAGSAQP